MAHIKINTNTFLVLPLLLLVLQQTTEHYQGLRNITVVRQSFELKIKYIRTFFQIDC
jgi:hypothetical protein